MTTQPQPGLVRGFLRGAREVILLERAEERASAMGDEERKRRGRCVAAARARRAASRKLSSPVAAIVLLRDALAFACSIEGGSIAELPALERVAQDRDRVLTVLHGESPFAIDDLPFAEAEAVRASFEACIAAILGSTETRTVTAVRALRWGRVSGVLLLAALLIGTAIASRLGPQDVARGKPVITSALRPDTPTPDHAVDGVTRGTFGVHTAEVAHPFVEIDLEARYMIDRVRVFNRGDGWFDEVLPLVLELSDDGVQFHEVARKVDHFDVWTVPLDGRAARYVRVSKPEPGYIALNEIEVYGHPVR